MNARFTCWLSPEERAALDKRAREEHTSVNYLVRMAIRRFLYPDVSDVTRNKGEKAA